MYRPDYTKIIEWLEAFIKEFPGDVDVTLNEPTYLDVLTISPTDRRILVNEGSVRVAFKYEQDALAFKLRFSL